MTQSFKSLGPHPDFPYCQVVCDELGNFCHTQPYPTSTQLADYYQSEYREVRQESPTPDYIRFMDQRAGMQIDFILQSCGLSGFESALDIGCGAGRLLNTLGGKCVQATGYEADKTMAEFARVNRAGENIRVVNDLFQPENAVTRTQLITMSHVLEHVPDPGGFLEQLGWSALDPGGYVFVEVPNDPEHWVRKQLEWGIRGLAHINYFTEASLKSHLTGSGYEIIALRSCGLSLDRFIRQRKPKSCVARQIHKLSATLLPARPRIDIYRTSPSSCENIYLQAIARLR